jgi:hypothetical protein
VLENIRDHTMPHCIRVTAGLLYWFASNIHRVQDIYVYAEGVPSHQYFYYRDSRNEEFNNYTFGASWTKDIGDDMMLRSEHALFNAAEYDAKFFSWSSLKAKPTGRHQNDFVIKWNNGNFNATSKEAETAAFPTMQLSFEFGLASPTEHASVLFRNPWLVDPSLSDMYELEQLDDFRPYAATPTVQGLFNESATNNGGLFLGAGVAINLKPPYYSLSMPRYLQRQSMETKGLPLQAGDWHFREWLSDYNTDLLNDPASDAPGFPNPALYDSKAVIFGAPGSYHRQVQGPSDVEHGA